MTDLFSSTIIPTVGRATLDRAIQSVLMQETSGFSHEIIVVNDSGQPLAHEEWMTSDHVRVMTSHQRERSVARNAGAALARGRYLHFLDDDDWLAPGALLSFWRLAQGSDAGWLYGSSQLVDRDDQPLIQLHHELAGDCFLMVMAGEWIPLQASLIAASAFFAVGGFNPRITGPEDIDLLRRIALAYDLAEASVIVANIERGHQGSTTDYDAHAAASRWAREQILELPNAFPRMAQGATTAEWQGRLTRIALTSAMWNVQRGVYTTAAWRAYWAMQALFKAGKHSLSGEFWRAVGQNYASPTFARGEQNR